MIRNPPWLFSVVAPVLDRLAQVYPQAPLPRDPFKLDSLELGCGVLGCAYALNPQVVLKLTTSGAEASWARRMRDEPTVGMARVYAVHGFPVEPFEWKGKEVTHMWAIWRENVRDAGKFTEIVPMGQAQEDALEIYELFINAAPEDPSRPLPTADKAYIHDQVKYALEVFEPLLELADVEDALAEDVLARLGKTEEVYTELALAWLQFVQPHIPDLAPVAQGILDQARRGFWIGDAHGDNVGVCEAGNWVLFDGMHLDWDGPPRSNPGDDYLRGLQRAAGRGDPRDQARYWAEWYRRGLAHGGPLQDQPRRMTEDEFTDEWIWGRIAPLGERAVAWLDECLAEAAADGRSDRGCWDLVRTEESPEYDELHRYVYSHLGLPGFLSDESKLRCESCGAIATHETGDEALCRTCWEVDPVPVMYTAPGGLVARGAPWPIKPADRVGDRIHQALYDYVYAQRPPQ